MQEYNQNNPNQPQNNQEIPTINLDGSPNLNNPNSEVYKELIEGQMNNPKTLRRIQQPNCRKPFNRNGYIGLQILIIILTLATILGVIIGATLYVYTK